MTVLPLVTTTWFHRYTLTGRADPNHTSWFRFGINAVVDIGVLSLTFLAIYYIAVKRIPPNAQGFQCNDPSLLRPYHDNTIPTKLLLVITLALPFPAILGAFWLAADAPLSIDTLQRHLGFIVRNATIVYLDYVNAFGGIAFTIEFIKCVVGRLRPNFFAMCQPNLDACVVDPTAYISTFTCLANPSKRARNAQMSFPSGHAAASILPVLFFVYFLRRALNQTQIGTKAFRFPFQTCVIAFFGIFAVFCCVSRVSDNWHFTTDVIGGIGLAIIYFYAALGRYTQSIFTGKTSKTN